MKIICMNQVVFILWEIFMFKLSLKQPNNEMIINPREIDSEWQKYSEALKKVPNHFDQNRGWCY